MDTLKRLTVVSLNEKKIVSFLDRSWRRIAQPILFAVFGLGALVLAVTVFPLVWIVPASEVLKRSRIQRVIHYSFRLFLWLVTAVKLMEFRFEDAEWLEKSGGGVVVANHPTLLDVVLIVSRMPQADCIVKKDVWNNPFLRPMVKAAGYIPNDDGPTLIDAAMQRIKEGRKVIIFPEATRSLPERLQPFTKGFAHVAIRSRCAIWPVEIACRPSALTKNRSVFDVPTSRARLTAKALPSLNPEDYYSRDDSPSIAARKVTSAIEHYFVERVDYGRG